MNATLEHLLSPNTIRAQARRMLKRADEGHTHFSVHRDQLSQVAARVERVTRQNYPDLRVPFHSRWAHFRAGGVDRVTPLRAQIARQSSADASECARCELDLVVVSVLLDAGAGMEWKFREESTGLSIGKSEGLALASLKLFEAGAFSSDPTRPLSVDSRGLRALSRERFEQVFQVRADNPLVGVEGRLGLLHSLADALDRQSTYFLDRSSGRARPGALFDFWSGRNTRTAVHAVEILRALQLGMGTIWPGRESWEGVNLGDVWNYAPFGTAPDSLVPFHKLSQWLSYSMLETLERYHLRVDHVTELSGLAEYRNGGLLLDAGVLRLRDPGLATRRHAPDSELVIEWRALTLALLEELAPLVRARLGKTEAELPLGKVLEGGTWAAGREIARELRSDGGPPLQILSDGTVF